jgi:hypothetical protein
MRVSGNDDVESGRGGIEPDLFKIVQHVKHPPAQHDDLGVGIVLCPRACIYVSAYGRGRGNPSQPFDYFRGADIPGVDDVVRPCELFYNRGA